MARRPQRSERWSLRQVSLEAGVSLDRARTVVRIGHLDPTALTSHDVLVLRVAAMLPALQPLEENRPANATREVPERETAAIALVRGLAAAEVPETATLVVTADGSQLGLSWVDVSTLTAQAVDAGRPYLAIPIGRWAQELRASAAARAAADAAHAKGAAA